MDYPAVMLPRLAVPTALAALLLGITIGVACGPPPGASCRYNPLCGSGGIGATCNSNNDCADGHCCDKKDCDGGSCSLPCGKDRDCPGGLSCHGGWCYFNCFVDGDCAAGQRCKDDNWCSWD